jgi:hypothetical protein
MHAIRLKGRTISLYPRQAKFGSRNIFLPASGAGVAVSVAMTAEHITGERSSVAKAHVQSAIRIKTRMDVSGFVRRTAKSVPRAVLI